MISSKQQLAVQLSKLKGFVSPHPSLEQYTIPSEIAAALLWEAYMLGDITGKVVADFGAGTGILGIGAALLGAKEVHAVEMDKAVIDILRVNTENIQPIHILSIPVQEFNVHIDTVIQNPPFGVQKEHADKLFLEKAFSVARIVYSFHKKESASFLQAIARDHHFLITHHWSFSWSLKATMKFHEKKKHIIKVGAWRFEYVFS